VAEAASVARGLGEFDKVRILPSNTARGLIKSRGPGASLADCRAETRRPGARAPGMTRFERGNGGCAVALASSVAGSHDASTRAPALLLPTLLPHSAEGRSRQRAEAASFTTVTWTARLSLGGRVPHRTRRQSMARTLHDSDCR
jgi:hypothetical protein